jgi:hypothetical protein
VIAWPPARERDPFAALDARISGSRHIMRRCRLVARADEADLAGARGKRHVDTLRRQGVHEVGQQARGDGNGAFFLDLSADPAGQGDLQVGGGQLETAAVAGHENVAGDGQRAAGSYGPSDDAEAAREVFLKAGQLHSDHLLYHLLTCLFVRKYRRREGASAGDSRAARSTR